MIRFSKPCDECGGTGSIACITCESKGLEDCMLQPGCVSDPCPSCVGGWLPDDGMKEAARKGFNRRPTNPQTPWSVRFADALVAAARYQSEKDANCYHDWYRGPDSPPDTCLKCGARKDNG